VDALGVPEPTLQRSGERRIIVESPGVTDPDEALASSFRQTRSS
jgi:SecD/SecF fusion protein